MADNGGPLGPRATVLAPTSVDPAHPPQNILDEDDRSFWMTTGLFPQEVIIRLDDVSTIQRIGLRTTNVQKVAILASTESSSLHDSASPTEWETIGEASIGDTDGRLQIETITVERPAKDVSHIKIQLLKGWDDFCAVHSVELD